ncbi:MAG: hypothetical protein ABDH28_04770 [Brevinematia bacterium]
MEKLFLRVFALLVILSITGCIPSREEVKYIYDYEAGKTYTYDLNVDGSGVLSYFMFSSSGKFNLKANIVIAVSYYKDKKLYTLAISNIVFKPSIDINNEIQKLLATTNVVISFYMDEKGNKEIFGNPIGIKAILDLLIPALPEVGTTNELTFTSFNFSVGDIEVRNESSNILTVTSGTPRNFYFQTIGELRATELETMDITVVKISSKGNGNVKNYVLSEYVLNLESETTIPLYKGSLTRVIGFKGSAVIVLRLNKVL